MASSQESSVDAVGVLDTGKQQLGAIYAKALYMSAQKADRVEEIGQELDSLLSDVLKAFPQLEQLLTSQMIKTEDQLEILQRVLGNQASPLFMNFLRVLTQRERFSCIRAVAEAYHQHDDEVHGRVPVQVTTAVPLEEAATRELETRIQNLLGLQPKLSCGTDPKLIGGIVLRIGDTVYDGSVSSQLKHIRGQMIDRSVHEIQSRRDRFRHTDGD
jgi:F-type H+-transporting ATPase subunit delta